MPRDCQAAALAYARRGWAVLPLNGKRPYLGTHGLSEATTDVTQIRRWWKRWPDANVGIACSSEHGPIVLDVDGPSGARLVDVLLLPTTRAAKTGSGKMHYYFDPLEDRTPVPRTIKVKRDGLKYDLDVLGDGGYVIAPPSVNPETGRPYRWANKARLASLPRVVLQLVHVSRNGSKAPAAPLPPIVHEGERDTLLTSLAGSMRRRGASEDAILAALREENATRVVPPLEDRQLKKIAKSIASKAPAGHGENLTDLGNARRFVAQHREVVRSSGSGRAPWRIWDGTRWVPDETGEVERLAKATVRSLYAEASQAADGDVAESILKHAAKSESAARLRGLLELAATEPELVVTPDMFDADPWLFNVENGTIDLRTGTIRPHRKEDLITKLAPIEYSPSATCPRWEKFLVEVMAGDDELVEFLRRAIGYAMTGDTREQCLFFCYGQGANGKSTFLEVARALFGGYAQQADFGSFMARTGDGPRNDLARMRGARLVTASEAPSDKGFDEATLKRLTGDDAIVARRLYEEFFEFRPQHKIFLAANHKPIVKEQTVAFWRRMRLIPFTVIFPPEKRDKYLTSKLHAELPGILNWALAGCKAWREEGLNEPKAVRLATKSYREENDVLGEFFAACCSLKPTGWVSTPELYRAFTQWWLETRGPRSTPISMGWFGRMLGERPELVPTKHRQTRGWSGVTLNTKIAVN